MYTELGEREETVVHAVGNEESTDGGEALSRRGERLNRQVCRQKCKPTKRVERTAGQALAGEPQPQTERQRGQCRDCKGLAVRAGRGGRGRCRVRPMNAPEELR